MKKKNHYIPRCLLKRFASKNENRKVFIWQLSKDSSPKEISTKDVAVSKGFYGSENHIEIEFQNIENSFVKVLKNIDISPISKNQYSTIRNFVYYQSIRTRAFRDTFKDMWDITLNKLSELFYPEMIMTTATKYIDDDAIIEMCKTIENSNALNIEQLNNLQIMQKTGMLKNYILNEIKKPEILNQFSSNILNIIDTLTILSPKMINNGYSDALSRTFQSTKMIEPNFNPSYWEVVEISDGILILGDFCVLTLSENNEYGSLLKFGKEWNKILLPISPSKLLIGHKTKSAIKISAKEYNLKISEFSLNYYYASQNSEYISSLTKNISKNNLLVHNDFLKNLFEKMDY